jgi:squalene-associated FAD-dependent desaturase
MPSVVVVGAGVAGITAAVHLVRRGFQVCLVEARSAVGGRATSVWEPTVAEFIDCGQHVFIGAYREFLSVLCALGVPQPQGKPLRFCLWDGLRWQRFDTGCAPGRWGFIAALWHLSGLTVAERARCLLGLWRLIWGSASAGTVADFLAATRQPQRAVDLFWTPLTLATLNTAPAEAPVHLLSAVLRDGFLQDRSGTHFIVPSSSLLTLLQPIGSWLERHGSRLRLNTPVSEVFPAGRHTWGVRTRAGEVIRADGVVVAVPPWVLPRLVPAIVSVPKYARFLAAAQYSPIVTLYLWLKEQVMPEPICAFAHPELHWAFQRPTRSGAEAVALVVSAAHPMTALPRQELVRRCLRVFSEALPSFRPELLVHARLMVEQRATLRLTPELDALRPVGITPWRTLVVAGDWLQTGLPCTLEGAARSGRRAAEALADAGW